MKSIDDVLAALESKYGPISSICKDDDDEAGCTHFFYDEDCNSCKGNATGN